MTVLLRRLAMGSMVPLLSQGMHSRATLEVLLESNSACKRTERTQSFKLVTPCSTYPA